MKMKCVLTAVATLSTIFAAVLCAQAASPGPGRPAGGRWGLKTFLELKLSDSQQTQMMDILSRYRDRREDLRNEMREARRDVSKALRAEAYNEEEARKAFRKASSVREEWFLMRAKMASELKALLTPEQLSLLKDKRAQRTERVRQRLDARREDEGR